MTTLPQTLRHDDPDGPRDDTPRGRNGHVNGRPPGGYGNPSNLPALPSMPVLSAPVTLPAASGGGGGSVGLTGSDVMRVLRENLWLLVLALVLSVVAGYALNEYLQKNYLSYRASGRLLVQDPRNFDPAGEGLETVERDSAQLEVRVQTQVAGLYNPQMFNEIVDKNDVVRESAWLNRMARGPGGRLDQQRAVEVLLERFGAAPLRGSRLMNVSFRADSPRESSDILNVIINTRLEELNRAARSQLDFNINEAARVIGERRNELDAIEARIRQIRSAGQAGGDAGGTSLLMRNEAAALLRVRIEAEGQAELLRQELAITRDAVGRGTEPPQVEQMLQMDRQLLQLRANHDNMEQSLALARTRLGDNHREVQNQERMVEAMATRLADAELNARARARNAVGAQLEAQLATAEATVARMNEEMARLDANLLTVLRDETDLDMLQRDSIAKRSELERQESRLSTLRRLNFVQPTRELVWYTNVTPPTSPEFPRLPLTLAATVLVGVGLAAGLAFLREVLDTSVKSPRDVVRAGQMTVLGTIPDEADDPEATGGDGKPLALAIAHSPHSMTAEQYRMVRGRLAHVAPLESTRTILVTSPQPGDGKTTVACNLAAGLALNGRSVLLVDANFRRPALHDVFNLDASDVGLGLALADAERFDECVFEVGSVPNLHVMPVGPKPANATELVESAAFLDVLDRAFERFDVVVFDSGPILYASETSALAPQVDGVVSVVRARSSSRGLLGRLRDSLESLNVEHLGVVLNAVRSRAGGYYTRNIKTYYDYQKPLARRR